MKTIPAILLGAIALTASTCLAAAQDTSPPPPGERPGRGDRGGFNMEDFRKRMDSMLKESLKASDDEWTVLQPLIEKVQTKQREAMTSRFAGMIGNLFGGRGPGGDRGGSPESQALRTALENSSVTPEELKAKLTALRESRQKAEAEMAAAREDLRKVVSVRQEAVLVSMGVLE